MINLRGVERVAKPFVPPASEETNAEKTCPGSGTGRRLELRRQTPNVQRRTAVDPLVGRHESHLFRAERGAIAGTEEVQLQRLAPHDRLAVRAVRLGPAVGQAGDV